jgi:hypothetical protein
MLVIVGTETQTIKHHLYVNGYNYKTFIYKEKLQNNVLELRKCSNNWNTVYKIKYLTLDKDHHPKYQN